MNHWKLRVVQLVTALPGVPMLLNAISFIFTPAQATESLGMPMLEGLGRSTQLGDFTSFFVVSAGCIFYGAWKRNATYLQLAALLLAVAAAGRMLAWQAHGADFASAFIVFELISAIWLVVGGRLLQSSRL
ncbi:MAG: hypothetical protein ACR2PW_01020 [Gammaproteobacteria bacterium]